MGFPQIANRSFHVFAMYFMGRTFIQECVAGDIFPRIRRHLCILLSYQTRLKAYQRL